MSLVGSIPIRSRQLDAGPDEKLGPIALSIGLIAESDGSISVPAVGFEPTLG